MRRVTIAVIGNGKTTRANVEALISDTADSVDEIKIALLHQGKLSDGQEWTKQLGEDRGWEVIELDNYTDLVTDSEGRGLSFFILWDDEDPECQNALFAAQKYGINAYDLTDGLIQVTPKAEPIEQPVVPEIPEVEAEVSDVPIEPELSAPDPNEALIKSLTSALEAIADGDVPAPVALPEDDEELDDEFDMTEEEEALEMASAALEMLAKVMAKTFVAEVKRLLAE